MSGRGPDILTNIDGLKPLVRDEDIVVFGCRDEEEAASYVSQNVHYIIMRRICMSLTSSLVGFWIHPDVDVLDEVIIPAVDYHLDGGFCFSDLSVV